MNIHNAQEQVRKFHAATGCYIGNKPHIPPLVPVLRLRHNLTSEELLEQIEAEVAGDLIAAADALGDRLFVLLGDCVSYGIDIEPIFNEIVRSNMTKTIDGTFRADGKYLKGPSYQPPNLEPIIQAQIDAVDNQQTLPLNKCDGDHAEPKCDDKECWLR